MKLETIGQFYKWCFQRFGISDPRSLGSCMVNRRNRWIRSNKRIHRFLWRTMSEWSWINNLAGPDHTKKRTGMSWKRYDLISALKFIHIPSPYFWCSIMCTSSLVCTQTFSVSQKIVERAKKSVSRGIWPRTQGGGGWVDLRRNKNKTSVDRLRVIEPVASALAR